MWICSTDSYTPPDWINFEDAYDSNVDELLKIITVLIGVSSLQVWLDILMWSTSCSLNPTKNTFDPRVKKSYFWKTHPPTSTLIHKSCWPSSSSTFWTMGKWSTPDSLQILKKKKTTVPVQTEGQEMPLPKYYFPPTLRWLNRLTFTSFLLRKIGILLKNLPCEIFFP